MASRLEKGISVGMKIMPETVYRARCVGKKEDLRLTGEIDVEPGNVNFPFGGLFLQAIQFCMGVGCIGLRCDEQILGFLELALALLLLLQKLGDPALQLINLDLVGGIPVIQLLGHIH
jgi:hypothetical protein